jgi:hypothetical protein
VYEDVRVRSVEATCGRVAVSAGLGLRHTTRSRSPPAAGRRGKGRQECRVSNSRQQDGRGERRWPLNTP